MAGDGGHLMAVRVQNGDRVRVWGMWLDVRAVRLDRFASGGTAVVLFFRSGPPLRVHAADVLAVQRKGGRS